jgi:hypothetical protein
MSGSGAAVALRDDESVSKSCRKADEIEDDFTAACAIAFLRRPPVSDRIDAPPMHGNYS